MKILYLYSEVMGYTMATIQALVREGAEVHLVHWGKTKKHTPYQPPECPGVFQYPQSEHNFAALKALASRIDPKITVISGWQDRVYLTVAQWLRRQGRIVVSGFDGQWSGRARQHVAAALGRMRYFNRYYSHAWVAGAYQYEYARKLGFRKEEIIFDLYSADVSLFCSAYQKNHEGKASSYPRRFLFVGRYHLVKGLDTLLDAWQMLGKQRNNWELHLIGNGPYREQLTATPGIALKDFIQPEQLAEQVRDAGCFILPSRTEPWGVVVHEFAAAGLPLILSDVVGAGAEFLIPGLNGYRFKSNNAKDLANAMAKIIQQPDSELITAGAASHLLSKRITPETSAANLLSVVR